MKQWRSKIKLASRILPVILIERRKYLKYLFDFIFRSRLAVGKAYHNGDGFSPPPRLITLGITDYCNLRCQMCPFQQSELEKDVLPFDLIKKIIDEVSGFAYYIALCGRGETLLHPDLFKIINYIKTRGLVCAIGTNGTLLEEKAEELINSGVDILNISVDGIGETHDRIRGVPGTFQKVINGIHKVKSVAQKHKLIITINSAVTGSGYKQLTELCQLANETGMDILTVAHPAYIRPPKMLKAQKNLLRELPIPEDALSWENVDVGNEDINLDDLYRVVKEISQQDQGTIVLSTPNLTTLAALKRYYEFSGFVIKKAPKCLWESAYVASNGDLMMCDVYRMGNLKDDKFLDVWNNESCRNLRKLLKKYGRFPICSTCCRYYAR